MEFINLTDNSILAVSTCDEALHADPTLKNDRLRNPKNKERKVGKKPENVQAWLNDLAKDPELTNKDSKAYNFCREGDEYRVIHPRFNKNEEIGHIRTNIQIDFDKKFLQYQQLDAVRASLATTAVKEGILSNPVDQGLVAFAGGAFVAFTFSGGVQSAHLLKTKIDLLTKSKELLEVSWGQELLRLKPNSCSQFKKELNDQKKRLDFIRYLALAGFLAESATSVYYLRENFKKPNHLEVGVREGIKIPEFPSIDTLRGIKELREITDLRQQFDQQLAGADKQLSDLNKEIAYLRTLQPGSVNQKHTSPLIPIGLGFGGGVVTGALIFGYAVPEISWWIRYLPGVNVETTAKLLRGADRVRESWISRNEIAKQAIGATYALLCHEPPPLEFRREMSWRPTPAHSFQPLPAHASILPPIAAAALGTLPHSSNFLSRKNIQIGLGIVAGTGLIILAYSTGVGEIATGIGIGLRIALSVGSKLAPAAIPLAIATAEK